MLTRCCFLLLLDIIQLAYIIDIILVFYQLLEILSAELIILIRILLKCFLDFSFYLIRLEWIINTIFPCEFLRRAFLSLPPAWDKVAAHLAEQVRTAAFLPLDVSTMKS